MHPFGDPFYQDANQAKYLYSNGRMIGVGIKPQGGGGAVNFWLRNGVITKVTVTGNAGAKENMLRMVEPWTLPFGAGGVPQHGPTPPPPVALLNPPAPGALLGN